MIAEPIVASRFSGVQPVSARVGVDPAGHALEAEDVHRKEREVEPDEEQPEVPLARPLGQQPAGQFRKPVVEPAEEREHRAADQHVVKVRDDEVTVVHLRVERHGGEHRPP